MFIRLTALHGLTLRAGDGDIGRVNEVLFDDNQWTIRYLVAETRSWRERRKVLQSPGLDSLEPLSRAVEKDYYDHFCWPYYWLDMGKPVVTKSSRQPGPAAAELVFSTGGTGIPGGGVSEQFMDNQTTCVQGEVRLRSSREVAGYAVFAKDGRLGRVEDLIVGDVGWKVRYLAVDTHDLWSRRKLLLSLNWIKEVIWEDRMIVLNGACDQVLGGPQWDPNEPISMSFLDELSAYVVRQSRL